MVRSSAAKALKPAPAHLVYLDVFRATPVERIAMIKQGVPAQAAKDLFADLAFAQARAFQALNLSQATVNRKAAHDGVLAPDESERVLGVARLIGQLQAMIDQAGDARGFDAPAWLSRWLEEPLPALGGARPVDLLDTMEGQAVVSSALAQIESGAYA